MNNAVKVGSLTVGDVHPIRIMADIGLTNGGEIDRTFELIDICAELGVDIVKMQMIGPDVLVGDRSAQWTYQTLDGPRTENMYEMFCRLNYTPREWEVIANRIWEKGLEFICTSHYTGAVPILEQIGVRCHKICTWSVTHKRLVQQLGATGKPFMLDMGTLGQAGLGKLLDWHAAAGGTGAIVLHDFHTAEVEDMNFLAIPHIKETFGCPVGYTPQGRDCELDFMSIGLGVNVLEKRITVDRSIPRNGHAKALEPGEFREWLGHVRRLESALGRRCVRPAREDLRQSRLYFKSLWWKGPICRGTVVLDEMLEARRPGHGLSAALVDTVVGRRAAVDVPGETMLAWEHLE